MGVRNRAYCGHTPAHTWPRATVMALPASAAGNQRERTLKPQLRVSGSSGTGDETQHCPQRLHDCS